MKRLIALAMVAVMCMTFAACGKNAVNTEPEKETENKSAELVVDENGYADFTEEQLVQYIEKVELTADNWSLYFEDYCREKVTEKVNSFGEVSYSTSNTCGFGLKENVLASTHKVAFKFTGFDLCHNLNSPQPDENGIYLVDLGDQAYGPIVRLGRHYTAYDCVAVTGELYIYHFPEEVKGFWIDGAPKGDVYSAGSLAPEGEIIAEIYNQYHK
ncbi:MAG: hypothetical protein IKV21_00240 [Clostridia bacterium]|nr:hypothetical protein [Clostridia bacterium]